jgi:hypothetical protein
MPSATGQPPGPHGRAVLLEDNLSATRLAPSFVRAHAAWALVLAVVISTGHRLAVLVAALVRTLPGSNPKLSWSLALLDTHDALPRALCHNARSGKEASPP